MKHYLDVTRHGGFRIPATLTSISSGISLLRADGTPLAVMGTYHISDFDGAYGTSTTDVLRQPRRAGRQVLNIVVAPVY